MKVPVLSLRPTQFALGMAEVEAKVAKFREMKHSGLQEYLDSHRVPVVRSPDDHHYLIDHHHLARACWEIGIEHIKVELEADLSKLAHGEFWHEMQRREWLYLHDQFGNGPHPAELLPVDIRALADDPFRSLAWRLREEKGFNKSPKPFCEFSWANFLRAHIQTHPARLGFGHALQKALELCHQPEAKRLPGYFEE